MPCSDGWEHPHIVTVTRSLPEPLEKLLGTGVLVVPLLAVFARSHEDAERAAAVVLSAQDDAEDMNDG